MKTILGCLLDFQRLILSLLFHKFHTWKCNVHEIIKQGTTNENELEILIGRLGHLGTIVPFVHHFLSRLRKLQWKAKGKGHSTKLNTICQEYLLLMIQLLTKLHEGIDMNIIAYRQPTHVYHSDLCPHRLGGYLDNGYA